MSQEPKEHSSGFMAQDRTKVDLIYRQAAIDALDSINCCGWVEDSWAKVSGIIEHVPSAQRTGRWIEDSGNIACSECHIIWLHRRTAFCPNCGARMEVGE